MEGPSPRIVKEVQKNMVEPVPGVTKLEFDPENYRHFLIEIEGMWEIRSGPKESLYEGGKFKL
jgi:ubiquitin-protein ligase